MLGEIIPDPATTHDAEAEADKDDLEEVWAAAGGLDERLQTILRLRYKQDYTLEKVGEVLGLTGARVRQLEEIALTKIRCALAPTEEAKVA